jgi:tetratricopeptide (TPR) repeat protein
MESDCLSLAAMAQINSGRPQAGISTARQAQAVSLEIENAWGQVNSAIPLVQGLLERGTYTEALSVAHQAVYCARSTGMPLLLILSLYILGAVYRSISSLEEARAAHMEAMELAEPMGARIFVEMLAAELCTDCALAGNWEEAYAFAQQARAARTDAFAFATQMTFWHQVESLLRAGEMERATEEVQRFGERIGISRRYRIPYLRSLAVLAESRGEIDTATQHLQEAANLAEEIWLPGELWQMMAALGELQLKQGDESEAHHAFTRAAELVQILAQQIEAAQLRRAFLSAEPTRYALAQATAGL